MFRAHLEGRDHPHKSRQRSEELDFAQVTTRLRAMNSHFLTLARRWTKAELADPVHFAFVGGGEGRMTREDILLHLANHATYHRGFVSTLLYPYKTKIRADDLTIFFKRCLAKHRG